MITNAILAIYNIVLNFLRNEEIMVFTVLFLIISLNLNEKKGGVYA